MNSLQIKEKLKEIPENVKTFLFKALILFVLWQIIYHIILAPNRIPDKQLTQLTANCTVQFLSIFYKNVTSIEYPNKSIIIKDNVALIGIADPCNAFDIDILYLGFLFCYPSNTKRKLFFGIIGLVIIFLFNILRCSAMVWLELNHPNWIDFSHHYVFTSIMYIIIFFIWVMFSKSKNEI